MPKDTATVEKGEKGMHLLSVGSRRSKKQSSSLLKSVTDIYPRFPDGCYRIVLKDGISMESTAQIIARRTNQSLATRPCVYDSCSCYAFQSTSMPNGIVRSSEELEGFIVPVFS